MTTTIVAVITTALLFGLFAILRPRDRDGACTGGCAGCTGQGACESKGVKP